MSYEDPYIWLESLGSKNTIKFIEEHNEKFRKFLGNAPNKYLQRIKKYYEYPYIIDLVPTDKGIYLLLRKKDFYVIELLTWDGSLEKIVSSRDLGENVVIGAIYASRDGSRLGFFYTIGGSDEGYLKIIDSDSKEIIDELTGSVWSIVWIDRDRYYYSRLYRRGKTPDDIEAPAERIFLRSSSKGIEEIVFGKGFGTNYMMGLIEVWDPSWIFIYVDYGWYKSKIYGGLRDNPYSWRLIFDGGEYRVRPIGYVNGSSYLVYYDGEGLGRIIRICDDKVEEVVGEDKYPLRKAVIVNDRIYAEYLVNASSKLRVYNLNGELINEYAFDKPSSIKLLSFHKNKVYFTLESFDTPSSLYVIEEGTMKKLYGYTSGLEIMVGEDWCTSSDGTRIHMFIVKNKAKDNKKAIVYGYGGFGVSITPFYLGAMSVFIEDGGTFVIANLRGGGEYGEKWHRMGMRENKQNVFEDFKAVLKHVKAKGYKVVGWGSSNGGLLVAATMVQEPELFDVALIGYPVIDMLRFHKLYIGRLWTTEYGDPDNPRDREFLLKYSPYHNVRRDKKYPVILVYTGLHDDRVHPGHALKFVAKLEEVGAPVYLRVETSSGHMGSSPEVKAKEFSDILAFIEKVLN